VTGVKQLVVVYLKHKSYISQLAPKDSGKIRGKQHFVVKVRISLRGNDQDMLVYNKEKTVYGSITSQMSIYGDLQVRDSPMCRSVTLHNV
jgi:hypothetical protein